MENLTSYSDQELSLRLDNEESLYNEKQRLLNRAFSLKGFIKDITEFLDQFFTYDDAQKEELNESLKADWEEFQNESSE